MNGEVAFALRGRTVDVTAPAEALDVGTPCNVAKRGKDFSITTPANGVGGSRATGGK